MEEDTYDGKKSLLQNDDAKAYTRKSGWRLNDFNAAAHHARQPGGILCTIGEDDPIRNNLPKDSLPLKGAMKKKLKETCPCVIM